MSATYTKLRDGSFGIRSKTAVKPGDSVTVTTKAGKVKTETIARVIWTGPDKFSPGDVWIASVVQVTRSQNSNGGNVCAECGRPGRLVCDLEDGLSKHYNCCDIPPD